MVTLPSRSRLAAAICAAALALVACEGDPAPGPVDAADTAEADTAEADTAEADTFVPPDPPDLALRPEPGAVVAGVAVKPADLIGGPKAEGQVGDFVLENHVATFLVEGLRPCGGYRQHGGVLVDADLQPGGEDRLGELWLVWNLFAFRPTAAEVVSDGRDGLAIVRVSGRTEPYVWIQSLLGGLLLGEAVDLAVTYEYRLAPDTAVLELVIQLYNDGPAPVSVAFPILATNQGDGAFAFAPGAGLDEAAGFIPWTGAVGLTRSYGFIPAPDQPLNAVFQATSVQIVLLDPMLIAPEDTRELRFHYVVTDDGTTAIEQARADLHGAPVMTLAGTVDGEIGFTDDQVPSNTNGRSWVAVTREATVLALTPIRPDGTFRAVVPTGGPVTVQAFAPARGASAPLDLAADASRDDLRLELPALGEVIARVRDPDGAVIPAQVSVFRDDAPNPFAPRPLRFDPDWGRGRSAVLFHTEEQVSAHLLPGTYRLVASRGYAWELDELTVTVAPGTSQTLDFVLTRAVDTSGWVAADLHLHAFWSPDSDVPYPVRLMQAAANDVALPVFTEHTYMGDIDLYRPEAGVDAWVTPVPGQEVSTVEYGHFNAYPLRYDATKPSGGAVFEHGWAFAGLFDAIRAQHDGEILVQVNHPRVSSTMQAYFNAVELDSLTGVAGKPDRWTDDWDLLEVFNARCQGDSGNARTLQDWFNLNDLGVMKALASGSDSHSEAAGLGHPRSWIPITKADVDDDIAALVPPLRARRSFVSCGPFVRFTAEGGEPTGSLVAAVDGRAAFQAVVEAPTWMAVDRVRLLENGVPVVEIDLAAWERPEGLPATVRFDGVLEATPAADAWYVLEVLGSGDLWPLHTGDPPYAMTNAIQVDADADGVWVPPATSGTTRPMAHRQIPADARDHYHDHDAIPVEMPLPARRHRAGHGHSHGPGGHHHGPGGHHHP